MSQEDYTYYARRADEEQAQAASARTFEAKAAHEQLRSLYLLRIGRFTAAPDFAIYASRGA